MDPSGPLLADEDFVNWAKNPAATSRSFLDKWKKQHPGKERELAIARELVLRVCYKHQVCASEVDMIKVRDNISMNRRSSGSPNTFRVPLADGLRCWPLLLLLGWNG